MRKITMGASKNRTVKGRGWKMVWWTCLPEPFGQGLALRHVVGVLHYDKVEKTILYAMLRDDKQQQNQLFRRHFKSEFWITHYVLCENLNFNVHTQKSTDCLMPRCANTHFVRRSHNDYYTYRSKINRMPRFANSHFIRGSLNELPKENLPQHLTPFL